MRVLILSAVLLAFAAPILNGADQNGPAEPPVTFPEGPLGPGPGGPGAGGPPPGAFAPGRPGAVFDERESFFAPHPPLLIRDVAW